MMNMLKIICGVLLLALLIPAPVNAKPFTLGTSFDIDLGEDCEIGPKQDVLCGPKDNPNAKYWYELIEEGEQFTQEQQARVGNDPALRAGSVKAMQKRIADFVTTKDKCVADPVVEMKQISEIWLVVGYCVDSVGLTIAKVQIWHKGIAQELTGIFLYTEANIELFMRQVKSITWFVPEKEANTLPPGIDPTKGLDI